MKSESRTRLGWLGIVAALSGGSLVFFGGVSLLISALSRSLPGGLVSLAVLGHGVVELMARYRFLKAFEPTSGRCLWINQLVLAANITVYAFWQLHQLSDEAIAKLMAHPNVQELLALYPIESRSYLMDMLPMMSRLLYVAVIGVAWLGCGVTAYYYLKKIKAVRAV